MRKAVMNRLIYQDEAGGMKVFWGAMYWGVDSHFSFKIRIHLLAPERAVTEIWLLLPYFLDEAHAQRGE